MGLYDLASLEGLPSTIKGTEDANLTVDWGKWNANAKDLDKVTNSEWYAFQCSAAINSDWTDEGRLTGFKVGD